MGQPNPWTTLVLQPSLHYNIGLFLRTDLLWNVDMMRRDQLSPALGLSTAVSPSFILLLSRVFRHLVYVDDSPVRVQLALKEFVHRSDLVAHN